MPKHLNQPKNKTGNISFLWFLGFPTTTLGGLNAYSILGYLSPIWHELPSSMFKPFEPKCSMDALTLLPTVEQNLSISCHPLPLLFLM
jgi:hypothetical protein